jgi:hypothetical protein
MVTKPDVTSHIQINIIQPAQSKSTNNLYYSNVKLP